jgi:phospholipid/cholesterol/gamma-HCH transport system substrate-binding protein
VSDLRLRPGGVVIELAIDADKQVPANATAAVSALSAIGEQYVDLRPHGAGPPYLQDGTVIPESRASTPLPVATLLVDLEQVVSSIDPHDLDVVVTELSTAFADSGPKLRELVSGANAVIDSLRAAAPQTVDLVQHAADFHTFSVSLAQLTDRLKASDGDLQALLANGQTAVPELDQFVRETSPALGVLLGNLVTFGDIAVARVPAIEQFLVALPDAGSKLTSIVRNGQLEAELYIDTRDPYCGYLSPGEARSPLDTSSRPPFVNKDCGTTAPDLLQRGGRNAPRPAGDATTNPPSGAAGDAQGPAVSAAADPGAQTPGGAVETTYDPKTGIVNVPGGGSVRLGPSHQGGSWLGLLLALLSG